MSAVKNVVLPKVSGRGLGGADELLESLRVQLVSDVIDASKANGMLMPSHLQELVRAISERLFDESLNVKTLKATCGARDHNISSEFKRYCHRSIKECIESCRVRVAAKVLLSCDLPINEVAFRVGYCHIQTFQRAFWRHFHCTPGSYRQRALVAPLVGLV